MSVAVRFQAISRRVSPGCSYNAWRRMPLRSYSSAVSPLSDTLPLSGIRVLDMTRVLAGVSTYVLDML